MTKRCVIISGGDFFPIAPPGGDDFVIACDRGYSYARRCGIVPDLVVSDFDSYSGEIEAGVPVHSLPVEKDDTDTMFAIRYAVEQGFESVHLLCALGGRLDHSLANLQSLVFAQAHGLRASMEDADNCICTLRDGKMRFPRREGWSFSVFAAEGRCSGVSIRGAKYPLERGELLGSFPLGVSNAWAADEIELSVESGILLIVQSRL